MKNKVENLIGEHSLQYSRGKLGFIMKFCVHTTFVFI